MCKSLRGSLRRTSVLRGRHHSNAIIRPACGSNLYLEKNEMDAVKKREVNGSEVKHIRVQEVSFVLSRGQVDLGL